MTFVSTALRCPTPTTENIKGVRSRPTCSVPPEYEDSRALLLQESDFAAGPEVVFDLR